MAEVDAQKQALRRAARENRLTLARPGFAGEIARHSDALGIAPGAVVGGYHALPDEADPAALLERLAALGCRIAFPRVTGKGLKLEFHVVPDGESLAPGAFGICEPHASWPRANPTVLLVPLLAFDGSGHRLGYGGGYYDRTIDDLPGVRTIGIAYAGQEVAAVPREPHDHALDMIVTENGVRPFPR